MDPVYALAVLLAFPAGLGLSTIMANCFSELPFVRGRICKDGLRHTFELTAARGYICRRCGGGFDGHTIHEAEFVNYMQDLDGKLTPAGDWHL